MDSICGLLVVDVHVYHGGVFIGNLDYVGGEKHMLSKYEWVFLGQDMDILRDKLGYARIVKAAVKLKGSNVFTFLPHDVAEVANLIERAIDVEGKIVEVYVEAMRKHDERSTQIHGGIDNSSDTGVHDNVGGTNTDISNGENIGIEASGVSDKGKRKMVEDPYLANLADDMIYESDSDFIEEGLENLDDIDDYVYSDHSDDDDEVITARKVLRAARLKEKTDAQAQVDANEELAMIEFEDGEIEPGYYAQNTNLKNFDWELGMKFKDKEECKDAVVSWAIANGWNIKWTRSNKKRVQAECVKGCNWRLYASKETDGPTFMIKSYNSRHSCIRVKRNRQANRIWTSKQLESIIKWNPGTVASQLIQGILEKHDVSINPQMCYRARKLDFEHIRGSLHDDYRKLRSYVAELRRCDLRGKFVLDCDIAKPEKPIFRRIYIGFSSLQRGFFTGCRHLISFDACFLKTVLGGALLATIGKDCNFQMFPISWAVVEKENEETWTWFLENLFEQFGVTDGLGLSFMSDKQKGLINAIHKLASYAEHRHCARHVYVNFKKKWHGEKFRDLFWGCVKASTISQYEAGLANLKVESEQAWADFTEKNPQSFCKSLISSYNKTDVVENNICESFNSFILEARDKPILQMLETIRTKIMARHHDIANTLDKCTDVIGSNVRKRIYKLERFASHCRIKPAVGNKYEVHYKNEAFIVDLVGKECACRDWDLTGIPCYHALACINYTRRDVVDFIDPFFFTKNAIELYTHGLQPIHGQQDWPKDDLPPILPPKVHKMPGRPKKQRKRELDEIKKKTAQTLTRHGMKMRCQNCYSFGHNKRSCKGVQVTTSTENASTNGKRNFEKDKRLANQGLEVLQTESGNVFVRSSVGANSVFVSGAQATVDALKAIKAREKSQTKKKPEGDSSQIGGSQVIDPTPK